MQSHQATLLLAVQYLVCRLRFLHELHPHAPAKTVHSNRMMHFSQQGRHTAILQMLSESGGAIGDAKISHA